MFTFRTIYKNLLVKYYETQVSHPLPLQRGGTSQKNKFSNRKGKLDKAPKGEIVGESKKKKKKKVAA